MTKNRLFYIILISIIGLISFEKSSIAQKIQSNESFKIIGYYKGTSAEVGKFEYQKLTHIIFCFTYLKGNKVYLKDSIDEDILKLLVLQKKKYPKLKVLAALGGWGGCETCSSIFNIDSNRRIFAKSVKDFVLKYNLDGFDIDWESPVIGGYKNHPAIPEDKDNFTELLKQLRRQLPPPFEICFDANSFPEYILQSVDWNEVIPLVDFINLMTYGLPNDKPKHTGHHTALYSSSYQKESVNSGVILLDSLKVPRNKIIIGAGFYGFVVQNVDSMNFGLGRPGKSKNAPTYAEIIKNFTSKIGYITHWDTIAKAPFLYSNIEHTFITFDNKESVKLKTEYAIKNELGGIMFWKLNGDTYKNGLLNTIYQTKRKLLDSAY